ncbi:MAG: TetR/AcrR family transcriptional regulator [Tannerella sp.]|jgi:AcrR family transcriptional regulator|nr:TetR/AcrR family transcriptional regulator [Tannerella sp.]
MVKERDREQSEEKLINAVGDLIQQVGFENVGINQVAKHAGFSKNLIYRYFGSLDGLIYAYMKKHDFWINTTIEIPDIHNLKEYLKGLFRRQILDHRSNVAYKRLRRWELSTNKDIVEEIRAQREKNGVQFIELMSKFTKIDKENVRAIATLINAGMTYLVILEEVCPIYNGIDIRSDEGWNQIAKGIDLLIDIMVK